MLSIRMHSTQIETNLHATEIWTERIPLFVVKEVRGGSKRGVMGLRVPPIPRPPAHTHTHTSKILYKVYPIFSCTFMCFGSGSVFSPPN